MGVDRTDFPLFVRILYRCKETGAIEITVTFKFNLIFGLLLSTTKTLGNIFSASAIYKEISSNLIFFGNDRLFVV